MADDDMRRSTDLLIREIHKGIGELKTGVALNKQVIERHDSWMQEHEVTLDKHAKEITKSKTLFGVLGAALGMAWTGLLAVLGWLIKLGGGHE